MKNKIIAIIITLLLLVLSGCNITPTLNIAIDDTASWANGGGYEKCTYEVIKRGGDGKILGRGVLVTTVEPNAELSSPNFKYCTTTCTYSYTSNDGVTDIITSKAVFNQASMYAVSSEKTVLLGGQYASKSYKFKCDYASADKVAYFAKGDDCVLKFDTEPTTLSTADLESAVLDNETLYYLIRSFNVSVQPSGSFLLNNLYDGYLNGHLSEYQVYFGKDGDPNLTVADWKDTSVENDFVGFISSKLNIVDTNGKIPTYRTTISRYGGELSGTPVEMWFISPSKPTAQGNTKVMARMKATTYAVPSGNLDYTMDYLLVDYTTVKA